MEEENKSEETKKVKFLGKETIITFAVGLVIGLVIMIIINSFTGNDAVIKVNGKNIYKDDLYNKMKKYFSISLALEDIDSAILNDKYVLDDSLADAVGEEADNYIETYTNYYNYTEEEFLEEMGFESQDDFIEYLALDYRRKLYYCDYIEPLLEDGAVQEYYDTNAFGKIDSKHILITTSDDLTDEDAVKLAKEIIAELDKGTDFDTVASNYTEKYSDNVYTENLGYIDYTDSIESSYVSALKELNAGEYTTEPVETSYGYHIIYCIDKEEKGEMTAYDKMNIIYELADTLTDVESEEAILIKMRENSGLKFYDSYLKKIYEEYCEDYIED